MKHERIQPDRIILIGSETATPIHGQASADGIRETTFPLPEAPLGENGFPLFRVKIARLVRETQIIVVEAPNQEYLQDHIRDVYDIYEDKDVRAFWTSDIHFLPMEGTHCIEGLISDAEVPAIVDVVLNGKEDDFEWPGQSGE